jgi:Ca2+:H+ antiporter
MSSTTVVQRTAFGRIADEEQGLAVSRSNSESPEEREKPALLDPAATAYRMADRFLRKGKSKVGFVESLKAIMYSSWLNLLLLFIPIAWVAHFSNANNKEDPEKTFKYSGTFVLCFLSIIPLEKLFDYGGEQMTFYLGADLGDLLVVTLNNAVEATLAIILLKKCELKLLQSTIIGVVILHLLLIPGVAFVTGGARVLEQDLHPHLTQLNHTLLTIGVMTLLLPAAFFAALDTTSTAAEAGEAFINDTHRHEFLQMSRGLAVILLTVYICSRVFLHNPPGENFELAQHKLAPEALKERANEINESEPEVNQWVCIGMLIVTIGIMAATAEWLVDSIEFVREAGGIKEEWFGLILLPLVSFSGDGFLAIVFFFRSSIQYMRGRPSPPATMANARPIDLSIQFTMFWMPFIVLLGWWLGKPMSLLFDVFEVALIISSCFIVNYVTADSKTNWAEGYAMLSFYVMIALCSWFYTKQEDVFALLQCESVAAFLAGGGAAASE